jgi:hypothetical protein
MIDDLDELLRKILIREMPVKNGEVDIVFDLPKREWSSRLNRPTLNLFLYDIRENATLRQPEWEIQKGENGGYSKRRSPARENLSYMATAWGADPEDEHRLLSRTAMALYRTPTLPGPNVSKDMLPESLLDQPMPIPVRVAQHDHLTNPAEVWSALDNEMRPSVSCVITLALNPYQTFTGPLVRTRDLRFGHAVDLPFEERLDEAAGGDRFWMVGGSLQGGEGLDSPRLTLVEQGRRIPLEDGDRFVVGNLQEGEYTLELAAEGRKPSQHKISVPSDDYDIEL